MQFQAMSTTNEAGLYSGYAHPEALHVLLYTPNLPLCNIVFDGEKYWFYNIHTGWDSRKEYKGHIPTLRVSPAYSAFAANLPFKVRDIKDASLFDNWEAYLKTLK